MAILEAVFADKAGQTPQEVERRRKMAQALIASGAGGKAPASGLELAGRLAMTLTGQYQAGQAEKQDATNRASANKSLIDAVFGGSGQSAPSFASQAAATSSPGSGSASAGNVDPSIREGIVQTAGSLGIDPVDLATAISYETAGTFDPRKKGPTTQWGQHEGLIQFGEPQAKKYGVDWNNPVGSQLGENGAVANYLRDTGVKPGMGLLDIYSAINAGGVGRYGASDANNGGAPGTVADKVNQQMSGHRQKALALIGEPAQVASLDPSAGMNSTDAVNVMASNAPQQQMAQPAAQSAPQGIPAEFAGSQQLANARGGIVPALMGGTAASPEQVAQARALGASQPQPQPQGQDNRSLIAELLGNPYTAEAGQQLLMQEMQRRQEASDPVRQMEMEKQRLELDSLRNPQKNLINAGDGQLYDPTSQQWITAPNGGGKAPQVVELFDEATGQPYKATWNAETKQYERVGGVKARSGMQLTTNPDGTVTLTEGAIGGLPKLTEAEGRNSGFYGRGVESQKILNDLESEGTSILNKVAGAIPVVGNYLQGEGAQKYGQAKRDFINAVLRRESGAVISPEEFANAEQQYFPQPGDGPEVIEQKRRNRDTTIQGLKISAGQGAGFAVPSEQKPQKREPVTIDGYTIEEVE